MTGVTSTASDLAFARVRLEQSRPERAWTLRTGYTLSSSKTYSSSGAVDENRVTTFLLDSRYLDNSGKSFLFTGASANIRFRDRESSRYPKRSGYVLLNAGAGVRLNPQADGDVGLGVISTYDQQGETINPALTSRIRARVPVGRRLTFDALATGMWPLPDGLKLDSDLTLNYRLSSELFLRLGWSANNLVVPVKGAGDWDVATRLSLLYRR